jgi:DNA-binding MarR family transcriptional regulator
LHIGPPLRRFQQATSRSLDFEESRGITAPQFSVLSAIVSSPGIDQRSVVATTFVDRSTVAKVIGRLVDRELVRVSRNPLDTRRDSLMPSPAGIALLYEATPELLRRHDMLLSAIPCPEREGFLRALEAAGYEGRKEPPSRYVIPSPDGARPPLDVQWGLGRLVRACLQRYTRLWAEDITAVTLAQWVALMALTADEEFDQRTLGEAIGLDKASTTVLLARMLRQAWITKSMDPLDGRRRILRLTPAGERLVATVELQATRLDEAFIGPLNGGQRAAFLSGLEVLAAPATPVARACPDSRGLSRAGQG